MTHLSEEELIALYYGESANDGDARRHLNLCRECWTQFGELEQVLGGIRPPAVSQRGAEFFERVWQGLRPALTPYDCSERRGWRIWMRWKTVGLVTACALLLALVFMGGRIWERQKSNAARVTASPNRQASQRLVVVVLTDHLDRTERLLVTLDHAKAGDSVENSVLQTQAQELLASNRLYRMSANEAGDPALAAALERLERVLAEVANEPTLSAADLDRVRKEMNTEAILFEIRVLLSKTPNGMSGAERGKGVSI
jgi:hypothetical protein